MTWGLVVAGVGSVVGGVIAGQGSKSAASTQAQAAGDAAAEQGREFDITQGNEAPYINIGQQAINRLGSIYGYSPTSSGAPSVTPGSTGSGNSPYPGAINNFGIYSGGNFGLSPTESGTLGTVLGTGAGQIPTPAAPPASAPTSPDYSSFYQSPDYQFTKDQGMQGIENSFSASGGAKSGNALKALADFNSGLASQQFGNYFNRQASLAGIGQTATGTTAAAGTAAGAQIGNSLIAGGDARASGIVGQTNAIGGGLSGAAGALGYALQNRNYPSSAISGSFGSNPSGDAAAGDYAAWSDRRLKEDVESVGKTNEGLPLYKYRLKGDPEARIGVMADEAKKKFPRAVKTDPSGYKKVNYMGIR